jgi:hypothetical protein
MTTRSVIIIGSVALCGVAVCALLAQGRQLSNLREEQKRLESARLATNGPPAETIVTPTPTSEVPRELLQLRAEVARLSQQQRELAGARRENEKLRSQLENSRTNNAPGKAAGAGYIKMAQVKWLGCNTPEDTLQSAFWAMQNRDVARFLETIRPDAAKGIAETLRNDPQSAGQFFKDKQLPPVFRIVGRQQNDEEFIDLQVEITPDIPTQDITFRRVGGQWKLEYPF